MASSQQQVRSFLRDFIAKAKVWDILFRDDRGKNAQTLLDLELRPVDRKKILMQLQVEDYCDGPLEDQLNKGPQMWIFEKEVKTKDVYIKITMGAPQSSVICISFHVAEHRLEFPFKNQ